MPWKLKRFSRPSVTEKKSFHLIITRLALNQHSLAKGVVIHLELNQTSTDSRSIEGQDHQWHTYPGIQHISSEEML